MSALNSFLGLMISIVFNFYIYALLVRLLMQKNGVRWHNNIAQFIIKITEPVLKPVRRFIPGYKGFDLSIVVICLILEIIEIWILIALTFGLLPNFLGVLLVAIGELGIKVINIYFYSTVIAAIMSWFPALQQSPVAEIVFTFTEPLFRFARRYIPLIGGMDLSPIAIIVVLLLINTFVLKTIVSWGTALLAG